MKLVKVPFKGNIWEYLMVKTILKYSCLAGAASLLASPAFAQEAPELI